MCIKVQMHIYISSLLIINTHTYESRRICWVDLRLQLSVYISYFLHFFFVFEKYYLHKYTG